MKKLIIVALLCFSAHTSIFCHDLNRLLFKMLNEENNIVEFDGNSEEREAYGELVKKTGTLLKEGFESISKSKCDIVEQVNSSVEKLKNIFKK